MKYYLAVDIGASSGRHILGHIENGKLQIEEIHRFENSALKTDDGLVWDTGYLFNEIISGLKKCAELGKIPESMGIDTWGVDYVLLDKNSNPIMPAFAYRDLRTERYMAAVTPYKKLYEISGIQQLSFNTIYQLLADKAAGRLDDAEDFLFVPEFFSYLLTGVKSKEYTIASTSALLDAKTKDWSHSIIDKIGLPRRLFKPVQMPGNIIGRFKQDIAEQVGFDCKVMLTAMHDTASAVASVPEENALYISSGTWSLLGIEGEANLTDEANAIGYTNEGAASGKIRFLKNIMGLWIIQQVRRELNNKYSFAQLAQMAESEAVYDWKINVNDSAFFAPESMIEAIKQKCEADGVPIPQTAGQLAHCIYNSLAFAYRDTIETLKNLTGKSFKRLCIVGGGSKNDYLNRLTAKHTGLTVLAGPDEATAIGNIAVQMLAENNKLTAADIKKLIKISFNIKEISNVR